MTLKEYTMTDSQLTQTFQLENGQQQSLTTKAGKEDPPMARDL